MNNLRREEQKRKIEQTEKWLDERWIIIDKGRVADMNYYNGAIAAIEFLGYDWTRDENGKHKIYG